MFDGLRGGGIAVHPVENVAQQSPLQQSFYLPRRETCRETLRT